MRKHMVIHQGPTAEAKTHVEPPKSCRVCGKALHDREDFITLEHAGCRVLVCCPCCAAKFEEFPSLYIVGAGAWR
jgi:hypothetical protein